MPTKQEVLDSLEDREYSAREVKHLVNSIRRESIVDRPTKIKIGDVYIDQCGVKKRPVVVISVRESLNLVIAVPLTTTNDELALSPHSSRTFSGGGYFTNQLITAPIDFVKDNFAGLLDDHKAIREVKKELKKFYKGLL